MLATIVWIGAALAALIGVYYLIPNVYHILATHDYLQPQIKHAIAFFALAVVLVVVGRFVRNSVAMKS